MEQVNGLLQNWFLKEVTDDLVDNINIIFICTGREAEYTILEDNRYYVGIINANRKSVIMTLNVNVTSKMYDITKAKSMCSTIKGSCRLNLLFPNTQFVILTTPNNGDLAGWYVELSFVARVVTYVSILGIVLSSNFV